MGENSGLVYIGKVIEATAIPGADFIISVTVVCGHGGKWKGVIRKDDYDPDSLYLVYLPDSQVEENTPGMEFLKHSDWRVKMRRFKGAPSEVVITRFKGVAPMYPQVGDDVTSLLGVTRYCKPLPANLQGKAMGLFPGFIPKTDELNYQRHYDLVDRLVNKPFYITEKADGSSTTAFRHQDKFGVCSRNLELQPDEDNGFWKMATRYKLQERLPEGYALQWETCGPKIQSNPMQLSSLQAYAFSAFNIQEQKYLEMQEFLTLCEEIKMPTCKIIAMGDCFDTDDLETLGEGAYDCGAQREGVVVRSQHNLLGDAPISFKVINLNYER